MKFFSLIFFINIFFKKYTNQENISESDDYFLKNIKIDNSLYNINTNNNSINNDTNNANGLDPTKKKILDLPEIVYTIL